MNGIDYKYDARIDKLIKKENGINFDFIDYLNAHRIKDRVTYSIYRNWYFIPWNKEYNEIEII